MLCKNNFTYLSHETMTGLYRIIKEGSIFEDKENTYHKYSMINLYN
jgi:hypothetical protein